MHYASRNSPARPRAQISKMKDARGVERGKCTRCSCPEFVQEAVDEGERPRIKCARCDCPPGAHKKHKKSPASPCTTAWSASDATPAQANPDDSPEVAQRVQCDTTPMQAHATLPTPFQNQAMLPTPFPDQMTLPTPSTPMQAHATLSAPTMAPLQAHIAPPAPTPFWVQPTLPTPVPPQDDDWLQPSAPLCCVPGCSGPVDFNPNTGLNYTHCQQHSAQCNGQYSSLRSVPISHQDPGSVASDPLYVNDQRQQQTMFPGPQAEPHWEVQDVEDDFMPFSPPGNVIYAQQG